MYSLGIKSAPIPWLARRAPSGSGPVAGARVGAVEGEMNCYRVWYSDGTAILVDAESVEEAKRAALVSDVKVKKVENLSEPGR
jgi:hypothetical protein